MAKRIKVPKRIAGVKIPKAIRKGPVVDFLNTPAGQVVLAQAVLLIGGAFAVDKARDNNGVLHPMDTLKGAGQDLRERAGSTAAKLTRAFAAAAHAFRDAMESGDDEELPRAGAHGGEQLAASAEPMEEPLENARKKTRVRSESPATPH